MINFDFESIVNSSVSGFEKKAKDRIKKYADKKLDKAGLPSFSEMQNIQKNAYDKVMGGYEESGFGGGGFGFGDITSIFPSLAPNIVSIDNVLQLGLVNKAAANEDAKNNPANSKPTSGKNVSNSILRYPLPNEEEKIPYMKLEAFKYAYDSSDRVGNKNSHIETEKNATIILPLPGNLASGMSLNFEDYSSFFAKLVRAHKDGEGPPTLAGAKNALENAIGQIDPKVWGDGTAVGGLSGLFNLAMTGDVGESVATGLQDAFAFVRVQAGLAVNPMAQAAYLGANIRTHSFEFNLIPRNAKEAVECKKIIEMLQYCSIGERNAAFGGLLMNYPSVWNVKFMNQNDKPINGMLEIPDAFLTEVNVTYSPTRAGFTVTRDNDPFSYVVIMTFKEAQNLIRDDLSYIRQGGDLLSDMHPAVDKNSGASAGTLDTTGKPEAGETTADTPVATPPPAKPPIVKPPSTNNSPHSNPTQGRGRPGETNAELKDRSRTEYQEDILNGGNGWPANKTPPPVPGKPTPAPKNKPSTSPASPANRDANKTTSWK